ncbi:hypothetical protein GCM10010145_47410 [Streptomyces ruber]|uniref:Uncharacterized protein n=2 Tax=Streptomyces TaxID=1883 RepID=A0A918EWI8_9ACTN|nr:hypothetical protein GCM10010145_47410 [Streptomyces ruber]
MQRTGRHGMPGCRTRRSAHVTPSVADLVERSFTRSARDQLRVTDITEHSPGTARRDAVPVSLRRYGATLSPATPSIPPGRTTTAPPSASSISSTLGHTMGAASGFGALACCAAL